jgi:hypothetical protein
MTFDIDSAERVLARSFPLRTLLKGAFSGLVLMIIVSITLSYFGSFGDLSPSRAALSGALGLAGLLWFLSVIAKLKPKTATALSIFYGCVAALMGLGAAFSTLDGAASGGFGLFAAGLASLFLTVIFLELARGFWAISRADSNSRLTLSESGPSMFSTVAIRRYLGIPSVTMFLGARSRYSSQVVFLLSSFLLSLAFLVLMLGLQEEMLLGFSHSADIPFLVLACTAILALLLVFLSNLALDKARAAVRVSIDELAKTDSRSPILFLRAFQDDQVLLRPPRYSHLGRLLSVGLKPITLDHIILDDGTAHGPVVALGNPRDEMAPYGAARGYYNNSTWQEAVADLAKSAARIIVCIDHTDSIWWDVDHIFQHNYIGKTLFLFHPKFFDPNTNVQMVGSLLERMSRIHARRDLDADHSSESTRVLGAFVDSSDTVRWGVSSTFSHAAYFVMLRWFLREISS